MISRQIQYLSGDNDMKKFMSRIILAIVIAAALFTLLDFYNTAGFSGNPDKQLQKMLPAERDFCERILWQIDSSSSERDVLALLGRPSRSLKFKKNWWVQLGGKKDRVGVYFNTSGMATEVVLDGGMGRFYYRRKVAEHENQKPEDF